MTGVHGDKWVMIEQRFLCRRALAVSTFSTRNPNVTGLSPGRIPTSAQSGTATLFPVFFKHCTPASS